MTHEEANRKAKRSILVRSDVTIMREPTVKLVVVRRPQVLLDSRLSIC